MGQRYGQENVRHTGYTGSVGPKRNDPPFGCQHFPTGAKSEQLFPLKIRKALKFPYIEDRALRFLAGQQLPLPPSLNSCFYLISKRARIPRDDFQSAPKEQNPRTTSMTCQPWDCYQPIKKRC